MSSAKVRDPKRYERTKLLLGFVAPSIFVILACLVLVTGFSATIRDAISDLNDNIILGAVVYAVVGSIVIEIITLPFDFYGGHVVERRYALTKRTVPGWLLDWLKSLGVQTALLAAFIAIVYAVLYFDPTWWWLWASMLLTILSVVMAAIVPVVLLPIFFKFEPLPDGDLKERLVRLSERLGTQVQGAYIWKLGERTVKANAALTGWGKTRRIIISDTLIESHEPDEIEVIIAHELGHHVNGDIWRGVAAQTVLIFVSMYAINVALNAWSSSFGINGALHDYANLPLLALIIMVVGFIALPLANTYSRRRETAADNFAIETTDMRDEFISAMEKLGLVNLSDANPHPLIETMFHSHPSINRRIANVRR